MQQRPPADESKRLQDLAATSIMDTLPEAAYDDVVTLAAYICDAPIAYISFIDDKRQWYKASINVPFPQTTLEDALCAQTIQEPGLVHVPDLTQDERFQANQFVQSETGIRFYAGYPLINSEGSALGTLCVLDTKVRQLDDRQRFALEALGRQVVALLELRRILNESRTQALHDPLTGLPNRLLLTERLAQACKRAFLENGTCAVLFIDLDNFKQVNDQCGHDGGDTVLNEIALRLRAALGPEDTVGRYGGDEFLVIVQGVAQTDVATQIATSIQQALSLPIRYADKVIQVEASIGSSIYPYHAKTSDELIRHADTALYHAKRQGKGSHKAFTDILPAQRP